MRPARESVVQDSVPRRSSETSSRGKPSALARHWRLSASLLLLLGAAAGIVVWRLKSQPSANPPALKLRQLTMNSNDDPVRGGSISPDGKYLAYVDRQGIHIKVIATGELQLVPQSGNLKARNEWTLAEWFPDATRLLVNFAPPGDSGELGSEPLSVWTVSVLGGPPRKLRDNAAACAVSPDGSRINFNTNFGPHGAREIWIMSSTGEGASKLYEANGDAGIGCGGWLSDGKHFLSLTDYGSDKPADFQVRDLNRGAPANRTFGYRRERFRIAARWSPYLFASGGRQPRKLQFLGDPLESGWGRIEPAAAAHELGRFLHVRDHRDRRQQEIGIRRVERSRKRVCC